MAGGTGGAGGGTGGGDSLARRAWRQYLLQLQRHPLRTKMITAGCLAGVSDSVAQKLSGYQKIEKRRLLLKMGRGFSCRRTIARCRFEAIWISVLEGIKRDWCKRMAILPMGTGTRGYRTRMGRMNVLRITCVLFDLPIGYPTGTGTCLIFGFAYGGPFGHFLHKVLDYIFKGKKDTKTVAKKHLQDARKGQLGAARTHDTRGAAAGKESSSAMSVTVGVDERERGSIGNRRWPLPSLDLDGSDGKGRGGDDHDPVVATSVSGKCAGGESGSMASYRSAVARLLPAASLCLPDVLLEQITSSPWNNLLFLFYYGYVVESLLHAHGLLTSRNAERPFKEVKTRVKKQYLSVQLSAWMLLSQLKRLALMWSSFCFLKGDISQPSRQSHVFEAVIDRFSGGITLLHNGSNWPENKDADCYVIYR
uniref:Peroxisomal membrane protein PMP22 n=1 Tax=Aegilops tauschii TaxID=37682 RepID=M8CMX9_AEGTA